MSRHYSETNKSDQNHCQFTYTSLSFAGFLFEYVSGANFLGEIVEWIGFSVACFNVPSVAFAVFTLCNIGPRALHHHRYIK